MIDVAQEAMEALLVLHQLEKIQMWNPEAPINTFWDVKYKQRCIFRTYQRWRREEMEILFSAPKCCSQFRKK